MTPKQRVDQHDKEIAEIRALQKEFRLDLKILEKSMIDLVNQQAETNRTVNKLARKIDRFVDSWRMQNGHRKRS